MFNIFLRKKLNSKLIDSTTVIIHRLNIPIKLRAVSLTEMFLIGLNYSCGNIKKADIGAELIIAATTNFDWNDNQVLEEFNLDNGKQAVNKILLAGEVSLLLDKILEISLKNIIKI